MDINNMSDKEEENFEALIDRIAIRVVAKMVNLQSMVDWSNAMDTAIVDDYEDKLDLTDEDKGMAELAKYMTLMHLFQDREEYEKCAIIKKIIKNINKRLK
tara:strand:- start:1692 stop:1994 length:303 start_codon:yes stop_codon:yes gene_type:complete